MRTYNKKIIPIYTEQSDKMYVDDLIKSSPEAFSSDLKVREYIREYRLNTSLRLREKLIKMYGKYVITLAKRYQTQGLPLGDLISEGMIGLINAIENYDTEHKTKFITYSHTVISRQIREALDTFNNPVHVPKNVRNIKAKTRETLSKLNHNGADEYSIMDDIDDDQMEFVMNPHAHTKFRLSNRVESTSDRTHEDMLESKHDTPDSELHKADLIKVLDALFKTQLTTVEASVLRMFFGMNSEYAPLTVQDIGDIMKLSGERVRQLKESGLKRLKTEETFALLREYL